MPRKGMKTLLFTFKSKQPSWPSSPTGDASTSYSLASTPRRNTQTMIEKSIAIADLMFTKWNPDTSGYAQVTSLFYENRQEAKEFIKCVFNLQKSMHLISHDDPNNNLVRAHTLMQIAMKRLQKEFYQILSTNRAHLDPESVSTRSSRTSSTASISDFEDELSQSAENSISENEQVSLLAMENLRCIAECMLSSGYAMECYKIYTIIRKSIIDEALYKLGIQKISQNQFNKLTSQSQDLKVQQWQHATKITLTTLFPGELILCNHIFESSDTLREACFVETTKEAANLLFTFPQLIMTNTNNNKSAEKMLCLLDIYSTLIDHLNHIDTVFSSDSSSAVRAQATNYLPKLADTVRSMFHDFESNIRKNTLKANYAAAGGGVDPLVIYTMDTLSSISNHAEIVNDILSTHQAKSTDAIFTEEVTSPTSPITIHVTSLINVVLIKIDDRSKLYKDTSTSFLFIANNLNHVISKINRSNLKYIIGDRWIRNQEKKFKNTISNYVSAAWGGVYGALPDPTTAISAAEAKERFKRFNLRFSEAYRKQSLCVVEDQKLRYEIRICVEVNLVARYRDFFEVNTGRVGGLNLVVRYTPEDVVNYLSDLYFDNGGDSMSFASPSLSVMSAENRFKFD